MCFLAGEFRRLLLSVGLLHLEESAYFLQNIRNGDIINILANVERSNF